jgi:hypothetical protein
MAYFIGASSCLRDVVTPTTNEDAADRQLLGADPMAPEIRQPVRIIELDIRQRLDPSLRARLVE